jgi:hypothetical protein
MHETQKHAKIVLDSDAERVYIIILTFSMTGGYRNSIDIN